jgi:hypothetical protein
MLYPVPGVCRYKDNADNVCRIIPTLASDHHHSQTDHSHNHLRQAPVSDSKQDTDPCSG